MTTMIIVTVIAALAMLVDACPPIITTVSGNCCEVKSNRSNNHFKFFTTPMKSRVYNITDFCGDCEAVVEGYCDAFSDGGGWLVVQRRQDGSVDFNRDWAAYEQGFGSLTGEFWYGLRPLHCLTSQGQWHLRIDLTFTNGTKSHLYYRNFAVGSAESQYQLSLSGFVGRGGRDPMGKDNHPLDGMKFSTKDRDNDNTGNKHCAVKSVQGSQAGGWWYNNCAEFNANHQYNSTRSMLLDRQWHPLPFIEMKIRPSDCSA